MATTTAIEDSQELWETSIRRERNTEGPSIQQVIMIAHADKHVTGNLSVGAAADEFPPPWLAKVIHPLPAFVVSIVSTTLTASLLYLGEYQHILAVGFVAVASLIVGLIEVRVRRRLK